MRVFNFHDDYKQNGREGDVYIPYAPYRDKDMPVWEKKIALVKAFGRFSAALSDSRFQSGNYIDRGASACVFSFQFDGIDYRVRTIINGRESQINKHLDAAVRVTDLSHVEHIVAASYEQGMTVAPTAPGTKTSELQLSDLQAVSTEQLGELYDTMHQANSRGVGFDFGVENFFYDPSYGFTAIDLGELGRDYGETYSDANQALAQIAIGLRIQWDRTNSGGSAAAEEIHRITETVLGILPPDTRTKGTRDTDIYDYLRWNINSMPDAIKQYRQSEQATTNHEAMNATNR